VLIASLLLLVVMLCLAAIPPRIVTATRHLEAKAQAYRALENALEGVRSGQIPLLTGPVLPLLGPLAVQFESGSQLNGIVVLEVAASELPNLFEVHASIQYQVGRRELTQSLTTKVWRP
jgi:hypothetical protein